MRRRLHLTLKGLVALVLSVWLYGRSGLTNGALVWAVCRFYARGVCWFGV